MTSRALVLLIAAWFGTQLVFAEASPAADENDTAVSSSDAKQEHEVGSKPNSGIASEGTPFPPHSKSTGLALTEKLRNSTTMLQSSRSLHVTEGRHKIMRAKSNVYRTYVANPEVCEIVQYSQWDFWISGLSAGETEVIFWVEGEELPITYEVDVQKRVITKQPVILPWYTTRPYAIPPDVVPTREPSQ